MKSKQKQTVAPKFHISLNFTNNIFQTFLFDIFEKFDIALFPEEILCEGKVSENLIKVHYKDEIFFIYFLGKQDLINGVLKSDNLFGRCDNLLKQTKHGNITLIFFQVVFNSSEDDFKDELIFLLNSELRIKVLECANSNELFDYMQNYIESLVKKEEKSKLTFFESKPVASTNLCDLEGITQWQTKQWVKHLMCLPGISEIKAISIAKVFPTFSDLMDVYSSEEYLESEKENYLKDIEIINKRQNTTKRLGAALSSKIFKYFTAEDPSVIIN